MLRPILFDRLYAVVFEKLQFFIFALMLQFIPVIVYAQDKIYKTDNLVIEAKILKVGDDNIEYKKFSNPNGPTYVMSKRVINMLMYENGEKEIYNQNITRLDPVKKPKVYGAVSIDNARALILDEMINEGIATYAQLYERDTTNVALIAEYAYALALGGLYDASSIYLDRIRSIGFTAPPATTSVYQKQKNKIKGPEVTSMDAFFYASQIFALMEYYDLSEELWKQTDDNNAPEWIASAASYFLQKYKGKSDKNIQRSRQNLVDDFKRANLLASQYAYFQSIALFQKITDQYPDEYLPYVGYSIVLSRIGFLNKSVEELKKAISLVKDKPNQDETLKQLGNQLSSISQKLALQNKNRVSSNEFSDQNNIYKPQMMAYVGGSIGSSYTSLNGRVGFFMTNSINAAFDAGVSSTSGVASTNLGVSCYMRDKRYVYGGGLVANLGNGSSVFYYKVSLGLSFMRKKSSLDIFLDCKAPLKKDASSTIVSLSLGQSVYFGNRK